MMIEDLPGGWRIEICNTIRPNGDRGPQVCLLFNPANEPECFRDTISQCEEEANKRSQN